MGQTQCCQAEGKDTDAVDGAVEIKQEIDGKVAVIAVAEEKPPVNETPSPEPAAPEPAPEVAPEPAKEAAPEVAQVAAQAAAEVPEEEVKTTSAPESLEVLKTPEGAGFVEVANGAGAQVEFLNEKAEAVTKVFVRRPLGFAYEGAPVTTVSKVHAGGHAEELGLKVGWTLVKIAGKPVAEIGATEAIQAFFLEQVKGLPEKKV